MQKRELSIQKVVLGIILSIIILGVAQAVALMFAESSASLGLPSILVIALSAILYVGLTILGLSLMGHKLLSYSLVDIRLQPVKLSILGVLVSLFLPLCVFLGLFLSGGHFEMGEVSPSHQGIIIAQTVLFYGLAVGIVEEMIFRGIIFTLLEKAFSRRIAIVLPTVIFALLHIIGRADDVVSMIQVVIAGTLVGILFSLITVETGTIWSSALVHGVWNCFFVGEVLHFGVEADSSALLNYILTSQSTVMTGGDFGVEASIWAILAYGLFSLVAWCRIQKKTAIN